MNPKIESISSSLALMSGYTDIPLEERIVAVLIAQTRATLLLVETIETVIKQRKEDLSSTVGC